MFLPANSRLLSLVYHTVHIWTETGKAKKVLELIINFCLLSNACPQIACSFLIHQIPKILCQIHPLCHLPLCSFPSKTSGKMTMLKGTQCRQALNELYVVQNNMTRCPYNRILNHLLCP